MRLYKVLRLYLRRGKLTRITGSFTTFDYRPYLPTRNGRPGKWLPRRRRVRLCFSGWHVTHNPFKWGARDKTYHRVYVVETRGRAVTKHKGWLRRWHSSEDKAAHEQIRLLYEVVRENRKWVKKP